jgi:hypothetical protein
LLKSRYGRVRDVASYWVSGDIDSFTLRQEEDVTPPTLSIAATPDTLWPPNGNTIPVTVEGTITDSESGVETDRVTYTVKDEYGLIQPSGYVTLKADGSYAFTIDLQASRNATDNNGRQYKITVSAKDNAGDTRSADAFVIVPQNQRQGRSIASR